MPEYSVYDPNNHGPNGDPLATLYNKYPSFEAYLKSPDRALLPAEYDTAMEYRYKTTGKGPAPTGGWKSDFVKDFGITKAGTTDVNSDYLSQWGPMQRTLTVTPTVTVDPVETPNGERAVTRADASQKPDWRTLNPGQIDPNTGKYTGLPPLIETGVTPETEKAVTKNLTVNPSNVANNANVAKSATGVTATETGTPGANLIDPTGKSATQLTGEILREQFNEWRTTFKPIELATIDQLSFMNPSVLPNAINEAKTATRNSYDTASGIMDRTNAAYGIKPTAAQQTTTRRLMDLSRASATAAAANNARQNVRTQDEQILLGTTPNPNIVR